MGIKENMKFESRSKVTDIFLTCTWM